MKALRHPQSDLPFITLDGDDLRLIDDPRDFDSIDFFYDRAKYKSKSGFPSNMTFLVSSFTNTRKTYA